MYKKSNACHCNQLNMPWFLLDHVKEAFILTKSHTHVNHQQVLHTYYCLKKKLRVVEKLPTISKLFKYTKNNQCMPLPNQFNMPKTFQNDHYKPRTSLTVQALCTSNKSNLLIARWKENYNTLNLSIVYCVFIQSTHSLHLVHIQQ